MAKGQYQKGDATLQLRKAMRLYVEACHEMNKARVLADCAGLDEMKVIAKDAHDIQEVAKGKHFANSAWAMEKAARARLTDDERKRNND